MASAMGLILGSARADDHRFPLLPAISFENPSVDPRTQIVLAKIRQNYFNGAN